MFFILSCSSASAAMTTLGFWKAGNIGGVDFPGYGSAEQQNSMYTNPDFFCEERGRNYRAPLAKEYNIAYSSFKALSNSMYTPESSSYAVRRSGSLLSEWGSYLNSYNTAWEQGLYWVAEPFAHNQKTIMHLYPNGSTFGGGVLSGTGPLRPETMVACVRTIPES